jgi:DNA-directed RNA polymerase subunit L
MSSSESSQIFSNLANVDDTTTLTFQIKNTDVAYVNTLRRTILTGVECLAFNSKMNDVGATTDVKISANTTPMTNEMLADRIGLIPILLPPGWKPESWDKDAFEFRLSMENNTNDTMPVKVEDIQVYKLGTAEEGYMKYPSGNKEFFRPDPTTGDTCLLAVLKAKQPNQSGQKIEFIARASVGTGNQHIRWCPVSQCSYSYTIDTDENRQLQFFQRWLEMTKKMSLESLNEDPAKKETMLREFQTMEVQRCYKVNEFGEPNSFDFVVESIGTMSIFDIVERALYNIEMKCAKYAGELPSDVRVIPADARMKGFDFYFPNEDHTLGNLLQAFMEANLMDTGEISFVGYKVPHPLRAEMVLRIGVDFERDKARDGKQTVARAAISRAAAGCAMMFREWRQDWIKAKTRPIGMRNRESLRLNVGNARALEEAAARVVPTTKVTPTPKGKRAPQKSAFYGKYVEGVQAAQIQAQAQQQVPTTPNYGSASARTPNYGAVSGMGGPQGTPPYTANSPPYRPTSPAYGSTTPAYGANTPLPPGWEQKVDNEGRTYYSAFQGMVIQYDRPTNPPTPPYAPSSPKFNNNNNAPPPPPF